MSEREIRNSQPKLPAINSSMQKKQKNKKMIVVDNFCLSKKDIILLKEYFDKLSDKKDNFNNKCFIF